MAMVAQLATDAKLHILEIGAGTGGTTAHLLPHLDPQRTEYTFSDISPLFTTKAQAKFAAYDFVRYAPLDIEQAPGGQGFAGHQYDVVIAANVLHATRDLRESLGHVKGLLAPDGLLLLLEVTKPQRYIDLVFGLTEGWWRFADHDLRPSYALLSSTQWIDLLQSQGFTEATTAAGDAEQGTFSQQALLLARGPGLPASAPVQEGRWLIFADNGGVGRQLARRFAEQGIRCLMVSPGTAYEVVGQDQIQLDPTRPEDFQRLLAEHVQADSAGCRGAVYLWALDEPVSNEPALESLEASQTQVCGGAVYLAQALVGLHATTGAAPRPDSSASAALWLVTQGAQAVNSDATKLAVAQAPLWGLGRVISLEHPELWGGLVDLDPAIDAAEMALTLFEEIRQPDGEDQIAFRHRQRYVARLIRSKDTAPQGAMPWQADGAYLITGGLGTIGLNLARRMAEQGVRHLVLLGRSGLPERSQWAALPPESSDGKKAAAIEAIEALGAAVQVYAVDVADYTAMAALFKELGATQPPLRGVLHAAGTVYSVFVKNMTLDDLRAVLRAKMLGTWVLHQLTQEMALDCFVMFSSGTSVWGSKGLAHHGAANHFMDTTAHHRRALGLPGLSINWGWWAESNFTAEAEAFLAGVGMAPMSTEQAFAVLEHLMETGAVQKSVAAIDWRVFKPLYEARRSRPFLGQIEATAPAAQAGKSDTGPQLLERLAGARPQERLALLQTHVQNEVARVLGFDRSRQPDLREGLFQMGMDSLIAVELKSRLETSVQRPLPPTLTFDYPTIEALTTFLAREVLAIDEAEPQSPGPEDSGRAPSGRGAQESRSEVDAEAAEEYAKLEELSRDDVKTLLDQELAAIDQLIGSSDD
jgi:microcystin synthetase protein McyG